MAFSGGIRDYSASAFQIEFSGGETVGGALKKYFYWVEDFGLSPVEQLPGGMRDLEIQIRPLLLRNYPHGDPQSRHDLQRYLSFVVMDVISAITEGRAYEVMLASAGGSREDPESVFFCICREGRAIVLQFISNLAFKARMEHMYSLDD